MYDRLVHNQFAATPLESEAPRLWDGLVLCYAPCVGAIGAGIRGHANAALTGLGHPDLSGSRFWADSIGSPAQLFYSSSPIGPAIGNNSTAAGLEWPAANNPIKIGNTLQFTVEVYFRSGSDTTAGDYLIARSDMPAAIDSAFWGYGLHIDRNTGVLTFLVENGTGTAITPVWTTYASTVGLALDAWHHVFILYDNQPGGWGQYAVMIRDGVWDWCTITNRNTPGGVEITPVHNAAKNSRLMGRNTGWGGLNPKMEVALLRVWNRNLAHVNVGGGLSTPMPLVHELMADPLAMFRRRRRIVGKSPAAARVVSIGGTALRRASVAYAG